MQRRRGFTLIELLVVVAIIGVLARLAIPKFAHTKEKATLATMKADLRNLVSVQEAFFSDNRDYARKMGAKQVNGTGGAGTLAYTPSPKNVITITRQSITGWSARATNTTVKGKIKTCGIYVGSGKAPNKAVKKEGAPACY
jgi:prepilin-type N-terminal cleavage/methylation domain-containing protein